MDVADCSRCISPFFEFRLNRPMVFVDVKGGGKYQQGYHHNNYEDANTDANSTHDLLLGRRMRATDCILDELWSRRFGCVSPEKERPFSGEPKCLCD